MEERPTHLEDLCRHDPPIRGGRRVGGERRECGYPSRTPPPRTPPPQEPRNETLFSSSSSSLFVHLKSKQNEKKRGKTKQEKRRADEKGETKGKAMFGGKVSRVVEEEEEEEIIG